MSGPGSSDAPQPAVVDWLGLAAAPTFALMALLTGLLGPSYALCAARGGAILSGMVPMYALMSVFHLKPWLTLAASRRRGIAASWTSMPMQISSTIDATQFIDSHRADR